MTTSEVEALAKVYWNVARKSSRDGGGEDASHHAGLEAVARAVRAHDAARAGTLTAEALERCLDVMIDGDTDADACERAKVMVLDHSAAQGRANAALEKERDEARAELAKTQGDFIEESSLYTMERKSRLASESELAKAQAAFSDMRSERDEERSARRAAESALATLRQRLNASCPLCHGRGEYLPECELCSDSTHDHECPGWRKCEHKAHSLDATPAEHPDTATLHGIRERAKDERALVQAHFRGGLLGVVAFVLGDSRPSGGPGGPPLYRCSNCGVPRSEHPTKECIQWESSGSTDIGPSGGGEKRPMGHPCAGDSPAEVEKSRCPHSDFGDGVCTLPAGHAEPHRLSHDAPEIEDNSDSAFHTRLTASEEATLRMHINRAKAPPNDWSKHAKGCTVEWTPTPSGPTPRVWTCAPDCPSKATTPPSGSSKKPCPNGKCKHPAGDHGVDNPGGTRLALVCCHDCPCGWDTAPGDVIAEGPDFRMTDAGNGYVRQESKPTTPPYGAASEPTPEEDWRTVEEALGLLEHDDVGQRTEGLAALARLKSEPRRAAEAMRQRAADCVTTGDIAEVRRRILALPL